MRRFAMPVVRKATVATFVSMLSALMLQGCGGGGTPSDPEAEARTESLLAQEASHFTVTEVGTETNTVRIDTPSGVKVGTSTLLVIDKRTNSVAYRIALKANAVRPMPWEMRAQWMVTLSGRRDADQRGRSDLGLSQLLYVDAAGQLMRMDLSADRLGTPRRISALTICGMGTFTPTMNDEGTAGWLSVSVPDATGDCSTPNMLTNRVVSLDATPADAGMAVPTIFKQLDDASGAPLGVLLLETAPSGNKSQLALVSAVDLQTRLQTVTLGDEADWDKLAALNTGGGIVLTGPIHGNGQQALLKVGQVIRKLDWRSGTLRLGDPILTVAEPYPTLASDEQHVYVADYCQVYQIDANGTARLFATLPGNAGDINQIVSTDN